MFFCFVPAILKPVHLFSQSDLQEINPEINITLDGKKLSIHISLNEPFRWVEHTIWIIKKIPPTLDRSSRYPKWNMV